MAKQKEIESPNAHEELIKELNMAAHILGEVMLIAINPGLERIIKDNPNIEGHNAAIITNAIAVVLFKMADALEVDPVTLSADGERWFACGMVDVEGKSKASQATSMVIKALIDDVLNIDVPEIEPEQAEVLH